MVLHRGATRRYVDRGWLKSYQTFSFAGYHDPLRMHFGMLRVLNEDIIQGAAGFPEHPHDNMEIISIPIAGSLEHTDTMGNRSVININDVQIMSAGTGLMHSEFNGSKKNEAHFLQIWVYPKEKNIGPRYEQKTFNPQERINNIQPVVSPDGADGAISINQDAYFSLGTYEKGYQENYELHDENNGLYIFVLDGMVKAATEQLNTKDGLGVWNVPKVPFKAVEQSSLLFIEVPMTSLG